MSVFERKSEIEYASLFSRATNATRFVTPSEYSQDLSRGENEKQESVRSQVGGRREAEERDFHDELISMSGV